VGRQSASLALLRSDGSTRNLSAVRLAELIAASASSRLVVLQPCDEESHPETVAEELVERGVRAVAVMPAVRGKSARQLIANLYGGVLAGLSGDDLDADLLFEVFLLIGIRLWILD
jgi:hypothetical protein